MLEKFTVTAGPALAYRRCMLCLTRSIPPVLDAPQRPADARCGAPEGKRVAGLLLIATLAAACANSPAGTLDGVEGSADISGGGASDHTTAAPGGPGDAGAAASPRAPTTGATGATYLALGDSIAFGQNPTIANDMDLSRFVGYPTKVAATLGFQLVNTGCSGEASSGFVSATGADNGCRQEKARGRLHTVYTSTQLDFATSFLKAHPETKLVTIDIGANDLILAKKACNGSALCEATAVPKVVPQVGANARTIFKAIRDTGYSGPLVLLSTYVPDYNNTMERIAMEAMNEAVTLELQKSDIHGLIAHGYHAMHDATASSNGDACAAGLLIKLPQGGCDIHPTPAGRAVLEQAVLDALKT
jgi:lysophospholipase L1-like esterase